MSLNKNGILTTGSTIERTLPEGYTELEYIESTGTQYIDTGVIGKNNIKAETNVVFTSIPNDGCLLGSRTGNNRIYLFYIYPGKFNLGYGNNYTSTTVPDANQKYNLKAKLNIGEQNLSIDDTNVLTQNVNTAIDSTVNLYLFCNNYNSASYYVSAKVYTLKIWFNDILVRNFIPALRNIDNVPGMYDTVTKTFFINSGTGEFKYVLKGVPSDYAVVDYIQSTGTQYINTGVSGIVEVETDILWTTSSTAQNVILWAENSASPWGCIGARISSNVWQLGRGAAHSSGPTASINRKYNIKFNTDSTNYYLKVNNATVISGTSSDTITSNNLYLFANNGGGTAKHFGKYKLYWLKIYQNGNLIRNYIPCYRISDSVAGLYDTVNNEFKINNGTGTFTVGNFLIENDNVKVYKNNIEANDFIEL